MAPTAVDPTIIDVVQPKKDNLNLPLESRKRLEKAGIDLFGGIHTVRQSHCTSRMFKKFVKIIESTMILELEQIQPSLLSSELQRKSLI